MRKDAPFDKKIYAKAKKQAVLRGITLRVDPGVGWIGTPIGFPNVWAHGKTPNACVKAVREALAGVLAYQMEKKNVRK